MYAIKSSWSLHGMSSSFATQKLYKATCPFMLCAYLLYCNTYCRLRSFALGQQYGRLLSFVGRKFARNPKLATIELIVYNTIICFVCVTNNTQHNRLHLDKMFGLCRFVGEYYWKQSYIYVSSLRSGTQVLFSRKTHIMPR